MMAFVLGLALRCLGAQNDYYKLYHGTFPSLIYRGASPFGNIDDFHIAIKRKYDLFLAGQKWHESCPYQWQLDPRNGQR